MKVHPLQSKQKWTQEELLLAQGIALEEGWPEEWLAMVAKESGFNFQAVHPERTAFGLFQLTTGGLGKAKPLLPKASDILELSNLEQIELARRFLRRAGIKYGATLDSMAIALMGIPVGGSYDSPSPKYTKNKQLDLNGDLKITNEEVVKWKDLQSEAAKFKIVPGDTDRAIELARYYAAKDIKPVSTKPGTMFWALAGVGLLAFMIWRSRR